MPSRGERYQQNGDAPSPPEPSDKRQRDQREQPERVFQGELVQHWFITSKENSNVRTSSSGEIFKYWAERVESIGSGLTDHRSSPIPSPRSRSHARVKKSDQRIEPILIR